MVNRIVLTAVSCALLLATCCASLLGSQMPLICANYTSTPPSIDGTIGPEWTNSPSYDSFMLFNGNKPSVPTTLRLLYDEKNLYILYRCTEPKIKELKTQPRQHKGDVWRDDSVDFFLIPVPGSTTPVGYHFIANASGSTYNEKISYPRNIDAAWDAPWKAVASTDSQGWTLSMEIPWSALGLAGPPAGGCIEGNFGRVRKPVPENSALYPSGGFQNINNKVVIKLAKSAPGIQGPAWSQDEKDGRLNAEFSLLNPFRQDTAQLEVRGAGARLAAKNVNMIGGKAVPVKLSMPAPDNPEGCPVQLLVKSSNGKDIYFASVPFMAAGAKKDLALDVEQLYYYPGENPVIKVNSRVTGKLELKVVKKGSNNVVSKKELVLKPGAVEVKLNGSDIKSEGDYTVIGTVKGKKETIGFGIVPPARWPRVDVKNVSLGVEGTILINGSPYFPVDMYHALVEDYPDMAYLGFNTVSSGWNTLDVLLKELDAAHANGILCNLGMPDRGYGDRLAKRETYKAKVEGIKNHPALLLYHLVDEPAVSFYWIHFDLKSDKPTEHSIMRIPQIQVLRDPDKMTEFFRRFLDDQERKCLDPRSASLLLLLMLNEICVSPSHPPVTRQSAMTLVQQITTYIAGNYSNEISTSVIAKALVRNPDYLERIFKTATGISITTAIHRRRLKKAKSLLMESNFSIDRIAGICGFSDATYFRRIFKRGEGMSPSTYRKLYSQMHVNTG
jgi:AraC-like DNA-binding protein